MMKWVELEGGYSGREWYSIKGMGISNEEAGGVSSCWFIETMVSIETAVVEGRRALRNKAVSIGRVK